MRLEIHRKDLFYESGFTILEMLVAVLLTALVFGVIALNLQPGDRLKKTRDQRRIADLTTLDRIINEYKADYNAYPDLPGALRDSTSLPSAYTLGLANIKKGWIDTDLSRYASKLPLDPLNNANYQYKYLHNSDTYELSAKLEIDFDYAEKDGGSDHFSYELGNNLTLIP